MIIINFGKWSTAGKKFFCYERIYFKGAWTPFVRMRRRHYPAVITNLDDINMETSEGRLLLAATGVLISTETRTNKTPEEVLVELNNIAERFV